MSNRALTLACASVLLVAACNKLPEGEVVPGEGLRFVPQVADYLDDAGLGNAIALDKDGVPYLSYWIFPAVLGEGEIPVSRPIGAPYIATAAEPDKPSKPGAAVGIASLADNGIWTRGAAAQVRDTPGGVVVSYGPATEPSLVGATAENTNGTDIAIDESGGKHLVWTGRNGISYATGTDSFAVEPVYEYHFGLKMAGPIGRPSIAVDAGANPWIVYTLDAKGQQVRVATKNGDTWTTRTIATVKDCEGCPPPRPTQIAVTPQGPIVAYVDVANRRVMAARLKGGSWVTETVAEGVSGDGIDLAVGTDGAVYLSYYTGDGAVEMASSDGSGWTTAKVADVAPPPSATATPAAGTQAAPSGGNFAETTGVAVDDEGTVYVVWYDGDSDAVLLAKSGAEPASFEEIATQDTTGGRYPSVAVTPDGSRIYLAWYGVENQDLRLGIQGDVTDLAVAQPSPTPSGAVAPPQASGGGECGADGQVALDETAQGVAFVQTCLVAPAGQDFSIEFDNKDDVAVTGQHNIAIGTDSAVTDPIFTGDLVSGPDKVTYDVTKDAGPLDAGSYFFHCQVHPTTMTGVLAVVEAKGGGTK